MEEADKGWLMISIQDVPKNKATVCRLKSSCYIKTPEPIDMIFDKLQRHFYSEHFC